MLIKKETEYAIIGLIALSKSDNFIDVGVIARQNKLSEALLAKIFQKLAKSKIISSKFGRTGGFKLIKDPEKISLFEIMNAIQGKNILKCYAGKAPYCRKHNCQLRKVVSEIEIILEDFLKKTALKNLLIEKDEKNN